MQYGYIRVETFPRLLFEIARLIACKAVYTSLLAERGYDIDSDDDYDADDG